jgi:drug/metabolite transporter (DMT)-like permease
MNGLAAMCWVLALRSIELSRVFPLLSLNYLLVPLGARWFFGERLELLDH